MPKTPDMDVAHPQLQFKKKKKSGTKVMTSQTQNNRPSPVYRTVVPWGLNRAPVGFYNASRGLILVVEWRGIVD